MLTKNIQEIKVLSKGKDCPPRADLPVADFYVRCVAYKNIRAISRSHPRLKATERSEVTLGGNMRARMTGFAVRSTQGKCRGWGLLCSVAAATLMAVCCLIPSLSACASGARDYPVCPVGQRPVLDGKLDEPIWAELPSA